MYAAMVLAGGINLAIGIYPEPLYRVMPFPVAYPPYTAAHLLETLQLLAFTGIAFWLVIDKIDAEPTVTLDFDWFYRRPAPVLFRLTVVSLDRLFTAAELITLNLAHRLAQACITINRCKSTCYSVVVGVVSTYAKESNKDEAG